MVSNKKILLLGCGKIGGFYDFNNEKVLSHSKALSKWFSREVFIHDPDHNAMQLIANKYGFNILNNINEITLGEFEIVIIATPTYTHTSILSKCLKHDVPHIICEKPIGLDLKELEKVKRLYHNSKSKVHINYYRRFQEGYSEIKKLLQKKNLTTPTKIYIEYYKGLLNYASHAIDTINYLLDVEIDFSSVKKFESYIDFHKNDPSISFKANTLHSVDFEIKAMKTTLPTLNFNIIYSNQIVIEFNNLGDNFRIVHNQPKRKILEEKHNLISNYMLNVYYSLIPNILSNKSIDDNFESALNLNYNLLKII